MHVERGYRMEAPEGCPPEIYAIMTDAWKKEPKDRPTFEETLKKLHELQAVTVWSMAMLLNILGKIIYTCYDLRFTRIHRKEEKYSRNEYHKTWWHFEGSRKYRSEAQGWKVLTGQQCWVQTVSCLKSLPCLCLVYCFVSFLCKCGTQNIESFWRQQIRWTMQNHYYTCLMYVTFFSGGKTQKSESWLFPRSQMFEHGWQNLSFNLI